MGWLVGIDEAGYGPNLGPLVMTSVACRVADHQLDADLWQTLSSAVRKAAGRDPRLPVDDSKAIYSSTRGLTALEHSVLAALWRGPPAPGLSDLLAWCCAGGLAELAAETWYRGDTRLPCSADPGAIGTAAGMFDQSCAGAAVGPWAVRCVIVLPARFNAIVRGSGSKGAVLAHGLGLLLGASVQGLPGNDPIAFAVDKHGGRNSYAALVQHGLPAGMVLAHQEGALRSIYEVVGLGRPVQVLVQPRAESAFFCVALASMVSKYLREALMGEFNRFWCEQVPGLKPTAGYPGDSARFLKAITPAARRLGLVRTVLWRRK
jgi:ribonuclease HII